MAHFGKGILLVRAVFLFFLCALACQVANAQMATTLGDYWAGNAQWDFVRKWTLATNGDMANTSSVIKVVNGKWYMFAREFVSPATLCNRYSGDPSYKVGFRAYSSTDQGATWTKAPVMAIAPVANSDYSCQATDGDVYYDATANVWRFLFQCAGQDSKFRGCYAQYVGADPMGAFDYTSANRQTAVIQPSSLWNQICNQPSEVCKSGVPTVYDEGTFNIFRKDANGYYWVAFHGFDGTNGYRGIAKTPDLSSFPQYIAGNASYGLPVDAVLSKRDAAGWSETWRGGNIGAGHGSIVETGGYTYMVAEFADKSLNCMDTTDGQNWDVGIFRTTNVANLVWEQPAFGNPIAKSPRSVENGIIKGCNTQYPEIFVDTTVTPNVTYLKFGRDSSDANYYGTYLFRLNPKKNILKNSNFIKDVANWTLSPSNQPPNASVYRFANQSPDGTQFLATNCGTWSTACPSNSSVYQDINVSAYIGKNFKFGGQFSTDQGAGGPASLAIWQFDSSNNVLKGDSLAVNVNGPAYVSVDSAQLTLLPATRTIRYQFYHGVNAITYHAANLYVNITN